MFSAEYKAAWKECLRIAKAMYYVPLDDPKRKELARQLEEADAKREELRAKGLMSEPK